MLDEVIISKAITESFMKTFIDSMDVDVVVAGGGPSGLTCAYFLAKKKIKVALFEKHLKIGGGMPGGGMMFNRIVFQEEAKPILADEFGIRFERYNEDYYIADSLETISSLTLMSIRAGVRIFNLINIEDVIIRENRITGAVINWSAVEWSGLHVDPLSIRSKAVVDATGHSAEICRIVEKKIGNKLNTDTGRIIGERSMWAEVGEKLILDNTRQVYPGLWVCGMACNTVYGSPRMGAIFGGMILSGYKSAEMIIKDIEK